MTHLQLQHASAVRRWAWLPVFLTAGLFWAACSKSAPASASSPAESSSAPSGTITVEVVAADPQASTLTVKGPGLPAPDKDGAEVLRVFSGDTQVGYVGHRIQGELSKSEGVWRLDYIWPADPAPTGIVAEAANQLSRDLVDLGRRAFRDVGDTLPAFAFYNQNGEIVRPTNLRGQRLVINFIFTRCTNRTMCPASSARMVQLQQAVKKAGIPNVTFVTISFDPQHDTPGVLRQYGHDYGMDFANYQLLTAPASEMTPALQEFGILLRNENDTLVHSQATMLVSPEGVILFREPGENWTLQDFLSRLKPASPAS